MATMGKLSCEMKAGSYACVRPCGSVLVLLCRPLQKSPGFNCLFKISADEENKSDEGALTVTY